MEERIATLIQAMVEYDHGDAMRIQHFMKVHDFAATIAVLENIDAPTRFILEAAAVVHDIGIHKSEEKYGSSNGHYQEIEGPAEARGLLSRVGGFTDDQIERICYLVGHHHTYTKIDGDDYQILVESDFLVNIFEDQLSEEAARHAEEHVFRTEAGKHLLEEMFFHHRD